MRWWLYLSTDVPASDMCSKSSRLFVCTVAILEAPRSKMSRRGRGSGRRSQLVRSEVRCQREKVVDGGRRERMVVVQEVAKGRRATQRRRRCSGGRSSCEFSRPVPISGKVEAAPRSISITDQRTPQAITRCTIGASADEASLTV